MSAPSDGWIRQLRGPMDRPCVMALRVARLHFPPLLLNPVWPLCVLGVPESLMTPSYGFSSQLALYCLRIDDHEAGENVSAWRLKI